MMLDHPALPPPVARPWVLGAALVFSTALIVPVWAPAVYVCAPVVLALAFAGRVVIALLVTLIAVLSFVSSAGLEALPGERITGSGVMVTDAVDGRFGPYAVVDMEFGPVLTNLPSDTTATRGDVVRLKGVVVGEPGTIRGLRHRGAVTVTEFEIVRGPSSPVTALGNAMRDRVIERLAPLEGGRALLAGFLVGHTDGVDAIDQEAMRRAGLSHFTAVSGSNVALFLGLVYVAMGPLGIGPKRRAVIGLLVLPLFTAATRFEPSVLRAAAMAALGLGGRLAGLVLEPWQLLSTAVLGLLVLEPNLASNVGFQLSVAATGGVMVGGRWPVAHGAPARALAITLGAQVAVAPLLVLQFGLVPLLSPLVNLAAGPLVAVSTIVGALGVIGPSQLATAGAALAEVVLWMARAAAGWPQIEWRGLMVLFLAAVAWFRLRRLRGPIALAAASLVAVLVLASTETPPAAGVVVLDVGQGDAILISGGDGRFVLVDGGPDPVRLVERLRRYGVRSLQLVVLSHVHADHATGLAGLVGRLPIGVVWANTEPHHTPASVELYRRLDEAAIPVQSPEVGEQWRLGDLVITVEGPLRRYASPNDQSIVLMVRGPVRSMLLSGDVEVVAQAELGHLEADVLKVPHQGAATSDPDWLRGVGADLAVISVGPNDFGHPADWVVDQLEADGTTVRRTDVQGDVVVPLS